MAAQSRDEPLPYSLPATATRGVRSWRYRSAASKIVIVSPDGTWTVRPPSVPGTIRFLRRMLAKVPRTITRSSPRREPYELKSRLAIPRDFKYRPAGLSSAMSPAGEMWSVVTESLRSTRMRAPSMSCRGGGSSVRFWKNGGSWM